MNKHLVKLAQQFILAFEQVDIEDLMDNPELYGDCATKMQSRALDLAQAVLKEAGVGCE